jgi:hypothetical protein
MELIFPGEDIDVDEDVDFIFHFCYRYNKLIIEVTNPFKRKVSCNVVWENNKTMKLIRKDDVTNSMKKVGTLATITRCLTDDNTITSTIDMKRTLNSDGKVARAVITLKRQ